MRWCPTIRREDLILDQIALCQEKGERFSPNILTVIDFCTFKDKEFISEATVKCRNIAKMTIIVPKCKILSSVNENYDKFAKLAW